MLKNEDLNPDWFRIILDVGRHGHIHSTIAMACGTAKSTVQGWKQGAVPRWNEGERLVCLWCSVSGKGRDELPRISDYDWRR